MTRGVERSLDTPDPDIVRGDSMATMTSSLTLPSEPMAHKRKNWLPLILTSPAILAIIGTMVPFVTAFYYSFTNYSIVKPEHKFVGLANYVKLFTDAEFQEVFGNSFLFAAICLVCEVVLGLLIALLLNRQVRGMGILRPLLLVPLMLPPVIAAMMWKTMFASQSGPINYIFGLGNYAWFGSVWSSRFVVIMIEVWAATPFSALVLFAGLQSLPKEPFEAAQVDGASRWFLLRRLTLPMLYPFILLVLMFRVVDVMQLFDIIYASTGGGPMFSTTTLPIYTYKEVFWYHNLGSAIAKLLILWVVNYGLSFWLMARWRKSSLVMS